MVCVAVIVQPLKQSGQIPIEAVRDGSVTTSTVIRVDTVKLRLAVSHKLVNCIANRQR